jgi:hypothetical protein
MGIDYLHLNIAGGLCLIISIYFFLKKYDFDVIRHFGFAFLLKYGFLIGWLINLPNAFINEYEKEKGKYKLAQRASIPPECTGQQMTTWSKVESFFKWNQLLDPCEKWQEVKLKKYRFLL